jgi:site-specific DNA recombinase
MESQTMNKNAAIYARVSSDRQKEQNTIASQTALLLEYAESHDYVVPKEWIFEDEGYSGSVLNRPGLERLRDLASEGLLETVLVYGPDRLSRKYAYQVLLLEEFTRRGVETVFLKCAAGDSPEDRLLVQFQGMIAEYERAQIAERTRRGKRHRARSGCVNVLSGAPYGYRYIRKTDTSEACYTVVEAEAEVVRKVFDSFTRQFLSIGAIARGLNLEGVPTRFGKSPWERSTVWGMLRNPAYKGSACFGKTERAERKRITRRLRQKGGFSPRSGANRETSREKWIEVAVPALITEETFEMAQERLEENKRLSARRTKVPTLLQGLLVCKNCGYGLYLTSTKTSRRQVRYYRCLGSDKWRHLRDPACNCRPIRQDYLDELVWTEMVRLLHSPQLVQAEIDRRLHESITSDPVQQRKAHLEGELKRIDARINKLLDAYQEDLLGLADLRERSPKLRERQRALEKELESLALQSLENSRLQKMNASIEGFLSKLQHSAQSLCVTERQRIIRLVTKEIIVDGDTLTIHHCIPVTGEPEGPPGESYLLCTGSHQSALRGPGFAALPFPIFQHSGLQESRDYFQELSVRHLFFHQLHQPGLVDCVEVALDIDVHHVTVAFNQLSIHAPKRVMATAFGTEPVTVLGETVLKDRLQQESNSLLHHPVGHRRDPQRTRFRAAGFGYPHPFHGLGLIAPLQ